MCYERIWPDSTPHNSANGIFPFIVVIVQSCYKHLQWRIWINNWCRNCMNDGFEQWLKIDSFVIRMIHGHAVTTDCIKNREFQMRVRSCKLQEEILRPLEYL